MNIYFSFSKFQSSKPKNMYIEVCILSLPHEVISCINCPYFIVLNVMVLCYKSLPQKVVLKFAQFRIVAITQANSVIKKSPPKDCCIKVLLSSEELPRQTLNFKVCEP